MALVTEIDFSVVAELTKSDDLVSSSSPLSYIQRFRLPSGTAAGKADLVWSDQRQLAASASENLDLVGALSDVFGQGFSPARIKGIVVEALSTNANNVVVGAAAATQWAALLGTTGTVTLRPGSFFAAFAGTADATGYVCAGGSTDLLKIANSGAGTAVDYKILLIGASA